MKNHPFFTGIALGILGIGTAFAEPQPDFTLTDVNADSERSGHAVSPRDYRQQITVWYFGREW